MEIRGQRIQLNRTSLGARAHICAFFDNHDDEYRVLLPFIKNGLESGEKAVHTIDPQRCDEHLQRLASAGIDVPALRESGQFELRTWADTHLREGRFHQQKTLALFAEVVKKAQQQGFPLVRFITHMEWALESVPGVDELLEYEANANAIWLHQDGPVNPVICTYDLTRFGGDMVVDIMRTHPVIIIGGILQVNPFFVPPDEFLRELRARNSARIKWRAPAVASLGSKREAAVDEVKALEACISNLTSVLAIPAIAKSGEPRQILSTLLDVLLGLLRLDFVYVRLEDPSSGVPLEMVRLAQSGDSPAGVQGLRQALGPWLEKDSRIWPSVLKNPAGEGKVSIASLGLGLPNEMGVLVAGSRRPDFPSHTERLLLNVTANQAVIRLHEARLLRQQERVAAELDQEVASRTQELLAAYEEIKRLKDQLYKENLALREEIDRSSMFEEIVGISPILQAVLARVSRVAPTDSTVLIFGETGTGKELVARAIHKRSLRSSRAFVSVDCAAVPQDLIASELFGHEKGAFTGAVQRRLGRFELAEGGTIFLDEIGDLPAETQAALLRVLQEREFERVGGNRAIRADVRVISATNRDLQAAIASGTFRNDLFYRLNVFPLEIPPLRERKEDIPVLVEYFVARYASKAGKKIGCVHKKTLDLLQSYPWPGNIRELQNVIERSVIVCDTETLSVDERWLSRQPQPAESAQPRSESPAPRERDMIEAALAETAGRVSGRFGAAVKLGVPPSTLETKIRSLKINKYRFKTL